MQLNKQDKKAHKTKMPNKMKIAEKLAIAATALIGSSVQGQENEAEWDFAISAFGYSETDRVSAGELIFTADKDYDDSAHLSYKILFDSLTGSSANGAIAQNTPQTFTRVSANGQYTTEASDTPVDPNYRDSRGQFSMSWSDALSVDSRYTVGGNLSKEIDYTSIGINGEYAKDFNQRNTTLSIGTSFGVDTFEPLGGLPIALSSMVVNNGQFASETDFLNAYDATKGDTSDTITTSELLLGWTQVINRRTVMQLNYGFANISGYLTDPYKIVSRVDNSGITQDLTYENRPDSKTQHSVFGLVKHHLDNSVVDVSYRYVTNDFGIKSHTIDSHWLFYVDEGNFWQPHIRFYQQAAADFYTPFLAQENPLPEFVSADYRIGDMTAVTLGLKYGFQMDDGDRAEIRLEYYKQTPTSANEPQGIANLEGLDLYPEVDAVILQFNYYF